MGMLDIMTRFLGGVKFEKHMKDVKNPLRPSMCITTEVGNKRSTIVAVWANETPFCRTPRENVGRINKQ